MTGTGGMMELDQVEDVLIGAIHDGNLESAASGLLELEPLTDAARDRAQQALDCCRSIASLVAEENRRLDELLAIAGVDARPADTPPGELGRPLPICRFRVDEDDVDVAVELLELDGYVRVAPTAPAAWRSFRRHRGGCELVRDDGTPLRADLRWREPGAPDNRLARAMSPDASDWSVPLPEQLWRLYDVLHPINRLLGRVVRRRQAPDLGQYLQTPDGLIAPLLEFAGATDTDAMIVDLGCGDGRIVVEAAARYGCRARGIELDPSLVRAAEARAMAAGVSELVRFEVGDARGADLDDATAVIAFLPVEVVSAMLPSTLPRLAVGASLVAHEQLPIHAHPRPDARTALFAPDGVSVAHRWDRA